MLRSLPFIPIIYYTVELNRLPNATRHVIQRYRRPLLYLCVGTLLFVIDFSVTVLSYHVLKFGPGLASATGFCTSFIVGITLNKRVVFTHTATSRFSLNTQVALYLALAIINLILTSSIVDYFVNHGVRIEMMKPAVVIAAACWNYVILGKYIFGHKSPVR